MASKKKIKKSVLGSVSCPVPCGEYKPRLYLNLQDSDVAQVKELTVGEKVQILVTGTVKGLEQRERSDYDEPTKMVKTGEIQLEGYSVEVVGDEENEYTKMAEDDSED